MARRIRLLNYTTQIPATKTAAEIMEILAKHGATAVLVDYDELGSAEALSFKIKTPGGSVVPIRLPVDWKAVLCVFESQGLKGAYSNRSQATRTAWRIVKVWVEAQMAILQTGMVRMEEVFLPYLVTGGGKTLYQAIADSQFQLPQSGAGSNTQED
jgi:hypothetical protein